MACFHSKINSATLAPSNRGNQDKICAIDNELQERIMVQIYRKKGTFVQHEDTHSTDSGNSNNESKKAELRIQGPFFKSCMLSRAVVHVLLLSKVP